MRRLGWTGAATRALRAIAAALSLAGAVAASAQEQPPRHTLPPPLFDRMSEADDAYAADVGLQIERDRAPKALLEAHRRLDRALAALQPRRAGELNAYVVSVALDSDPVFAREAREAGRVLARRYHAEGRTITLAGPDGRGGEPLPMGSPDNVATALARIAEVMDPSRDVLVLYTTSHGAPWGVVYNDGDQGFGAISATRLWNMLTGLGVKNRLLMISACFSGGFVPLLQSSTTVIITASSADRTSFGCQSDNDWTFFGDALINHALRKPQPLAAAAAEASALIGGWEAQGRVIPSNPQVSIGAETGGWLSALENRLPPVSPLVGRPATDALDQAREQNH